MGCSDCHVSMEVGKHDALARVDAVASDICSPSASLPSNPPRRLFPVEAVLFVRDVSQVAKAVVHAVAVNVVNNIRLFAVSKKPSEAMRSITAPLVVDPQVSVADVDANRPDLTAESFCNSAYNPSFRVIGEVFYRRFWDTVESHIKPPFDVVRGLGTAIPSTPILPDFPCRRGDTAITREGRSPMNLITL